MLRDIQTSFGSSHGLFRLMAINIAVFLVITLVRTALFLWGGGILFMDLVLQYLSMPSDPGKLLVEPWTIITYMFLHIDFFHILINMLLLFWSGRLFTEYLGNDKLVATYLLGGLSGALFYLVAYALFPVFDGLAETSQLMGASAGVIAVVVGIATLLPDYTVHLLIFGPVRLKYLAIVSVLLYLISIPSGNAGGHIAHLGGAFAGFLMVHQLRRGRDLTSWITFLLQMGKGRFGKKRNLKVIYRSQISDDERHRQEAIASQELVDRILDKINKSGFDSLTNEERQILYRASKK